MKDRQNSEKTNPGEPVSRRRLLSKLARAGVVGAGAAVLGGTVMAEPALAGTDGDLVLGVSGQQTQTRTGIDAGGASIGFEVFTGLDAIGVYGIGGVAGVKGESGAVAGSSGVLGTSNGAGTSGVYGYINNQQTGHGVIGRADLGVGVLGDSTYGVGVDATSANDTALRVTGKAQFSRSGTTTIAGTSSSPKSFVTIPNVALASSSFIIATSQKNVAGVWVTAAVPNVSDGTITIHLNKAVTHNYAVGWMVIEHP